MRRRTDDQRERDLTWILVCTNDREEYAACADAAGGEVRDSIVAWLRERGLFWTEAAVVETSCLGLCSENGVAVAIQPRDEWFSDVTPADVPDLLDETVGPDGDAALREG